jgi:hypothetical protein
LRTTKYVPLATPFDTNGMLLGQVVRNGDCP